MDEGAGTTETDSMKSAMQIDLKEMTRLEGNPFPIPIQIQTKCVNRNQKEMNKHREILTIKPNHKGKCCKENYLGMCLSCSLSRGPVPRDNSVVSIHLLSLEPDHRISQQVSEVKLSPLLNDISMLANK